MDGWRDGGHTYLAHPAAESNLSLVQRTKSLSLCLFLSLSLPLSRARA